ncbi:DUF5011 domain-containing protein, partial [Verrucomicrobia bacterium]|nr:DUF5011 domain-containing protein [Verrucomicrobiota bacterium]
MKSTIIASLRLWINGFVYILLVALNDLDAANFSIENQEVSDDALTVTVPIRVSDFSDVGAMQFTLRWDPAVLSFKNLGDFDHSTDPSELFFFSETNFNTNGVANGTLLCLYEQLFATDAVLDDNVTIFSITFDVIGGDGISTVVGFSDDPTPRKLASFLVQSPDFISQDGTIQIGSGSSRNDSTAPVITLNGAVVLNHAVNDTYEDAGANATDNVDTAVTVITTGVVDVDVPGTYTLTYSASDAAGNAAEEVTRTVNVVDQDGPVITLTGEASVNHEAGTIYTDAGAIATDNVDSTVTVTTNGTVDANTPGTYILTYNATDREGNPAKPVMRSVVVFAAQPGDGVTFIIEDQTIAGNVTTVTVPVKVSGFANVGAMQFTLSWDPSVLTYSGLSDFDHSTESTELFFFGENNFNLIEAGNGKLLCLYEQLLSLDASIDDNETIFSVTFDVVGGDGASTVISFGDEPTPSKLASFFAQAPSFISKNATIQIGTSSSSNDAKAPFILLSGAASVNHEAGIIYEDSGASATDDVDTNVIVVATGTVDENAPGTYTLTYNAIDAAGNEATPVTRTVVVADTMAPVITLQGSAEMDVFINAPFVDVGSSVNDSFESGLTATVTGNVDTATVGVYTLSYNVIDGAGNAAAEVKRTVHVVDQDGPVIILTGVGRVNHEAGTHYEDAGATAIDNVDTTVSVTSTSTVDTETPGTYTVTYNASDNEGNSATPVTRTVVVADTISPIITLQGDATMTIAAGDDFTDPGSSANDSFEGELTASVTGSVNTSTPGAYALTYSVSDGAGNAATEVTRTVNVVDQVGPVITLNGPANVQHEAGIPYKDPGATATDNLDSVTLITTGAVDVNTAGTYTLTYTATDAAGNAANALIRTVVVADTMAPVITLQGSAEMDVFINAPFVDVGSSVNDSFESGLTATVTGNVDTATVGVYTLSYNVSDGAGNTAAEVTRTVNVVDQASPIITLIGEAIVEHEAGTFYLDPGATAKDNKDSAARLTVSGIMDVNRPGTYTLTFNATDSDGNSATPVSREIVVADTMPPVITLLGAVEMNLMVNTPFKDLGSSVSDSFEQGLTATVTGSVDTVSLGTYVLRYNVSDSSNNAAEEVTRTVHVVDHPGPILKLNGESVIHHEAGTVFRDPGAISMDNAGRLFEVTINGAVDENKLGTYTLTYNAKDDAGNPATEVTRDVMVLDAVAPVVTLLGEVEITHIVGTDYNDPGAQAIDNFDPSVEYELNGEVNTEALGFYTLRYDARDLSGNAASAVNRIVKVTDGLAVSLITSTSRMISENGSETNDITVYLSEPALAETMLLSVVATSAS